MAAILAYSRRTVLRQHNAMAASDRPVYLRLRDEIVAMILDGRIREGDALHILLAAGVTRILTRDVVIHARRMPGLMAEILDAGGLVNYVKNKRSA